MLGNPDGIIVCRVGKIESGTAAAPTRDGGKDDQLDAAVSRHERRQDGNSLCPQTAEHGLEIVGDMRSDGVHGSLKTTRMTIAPQFQLQRTSRGWVRRKK